MTEGGRQRTNLAGRNCPTPSALCHLSFVLGLVVFVAVAETWSQYLSSGPASGKTNRLSPRTAYYRRKVLESWGCIVIPPAVEKPRGVGRKTGIWLEKPTRPSSAGESVNRQTSQDCATVCCLRFSIRHRDAFSDRLLMSHPRTGLALRAIAAAVLHGEPRQKDKRIQDKRRRQHHQTPGEPSNQDRSGSDQRQEP